jgi:quinol-cytochrome oxidoreductase complex cytochrome b subunit
MSFWAATVITNLASAIPYYGNEIVFWFWGAFSVDVPTLGRFFSLHYLLPFVLIGLVAVHLILLHDSKSSDGLGLNVLSIDRVPFGVYYLVKDIYGFIFYAILFSILVFFYPNLLGHSDNYIEANPMVTPAHIVPEWYFLPFYAILRAIPDKLYGVILMIFSIVFIALFPFFLHIAKRTNFVPQSDFIEFYFVVLLFVLLFVSFY